MILKRYFAILESSNETQYEIIQNDDGVLLLSEVAGRPIRALFRDGILQYYQTNCDDQEIIGYLNEKEQVKNARRST